MTEYTLKQFNGPCLIFLGDSSSLTYAKTGVGLKDWRPEKCLGQLRLSKETVDIGLTDMTVAEAAAQGARTLVIGTANVGGGIADHWMPVLLEAANAGLDIVAGTHQRLSSISSLAKASEASGTQLIDVRIPPENIPVATGKKRTGKRVLMVGTDCAVGKKYTALAIDKEMKKRGMNSDFRATGQTGIMIEGQGIPIDSVVCDFTSGAAELISPDNTPDHWDVIEGQGALTHPGYAGVSLGLLHGSQPDAVVLCHEAHREVTSGWPDYPLLPFSECIDLVMQFGKRTNPNIQCVGLSINCSALSEQEMKDVLARYEQENDLPAVDPVRTGVGPIIDRLNTI